MNILVINAGSSSLKYQLMDPDTGVVTAKGLCERIGLDGRLNHKVIATGKKLEKDIPMPTHKEAIESVMDILVDAEYGVIKSVDEIDAVSIACSTAATSSSRAASSPTPARKPSASASPSARSTTPPTSWASKPVKRPCRASRRSPCSTPRSI